MRYSSENLRLIPTGGNGSAVARHYRDGSVRALRWDERGLLDAQPAEGRDPGGRWFAPALVDVQVNGYAGVDFQRPCAAGDLRRAAEALRRDGCARTLLTLITCEWEELLDKVRALRRIVREDAVLSAAFPGWHIEGPFLSDQPGFKGAHDPRWMRDPRPDDMERLREAVGGDPTLVSLAPERPGSGDAIRAAVAAGFRVSFGHSNASPADLRAGVEAGATGYTHLGNGCPQNLDRHDNIVWRVWDEPGLTVGLIPDGVHVSPLFFRAMHRALGRDRIYWTTDAMAAAGAPPGEYTIGEIVVRVGEDRIVRNPATGSFAGSALEPLEGIRRGARMLGLRWQEVWDFFSVHPARLMGLSADLAEGGPFCLLEEH